MTATTTSPEADVEAGTEVETMKHEIAVGADTKGGDEEVRAAPQARPDEDVLTTSNSTDGEMNDVKLTPTDMLNQRQNMKDSLNGAIPLPPPLPEETGEVFEGQQQHQQHQDSSLHQNEFSLYDDPDSNYDPRYHESALGHDPNSYRKNVRRIALSGGKEDRTKLVTRPVKGMRHSHPRKTPYRSEVARLRHAQQQGAASMVDTSNGESNTTSNSESKAFVSIRDTTAPPDTAFFAVQVAKTKHAILNSIGDFLTGAFADDEETSGSYYSEDLLEQLTDSNPYLRGVWLQAKNLNDSHVQRLCDALIRNKVVTEVWLPSNHISDVGAGHIAHMLKFNRTIKELFLGENDIGPRGAAALASAVAKGNTTLVALGLGDNHIGVEGAGAFAAALRHNHSLHTLDIKNNGIPRRSSIRGLLNKMLEFNASDPGDESLVFGLQEELVKLVTNLPPDVAELVVVQAEEALKLAMLCRRRGDKVGAAESEGMFIKICTTGVSPMDPPIKDCGGEPRRMKKHAGMDGMNSGMMSMKVIAEVDVEEDEKSKAIENTVANEEEETTDPNDTMEAKTSAGNQPD